MKHPRQMTPVGVKTTFVEVWHWGQELERLYARIAPRFARLEPRRRALAYLKGIVSATQRKNGWQLAEYAGESRPDGMQRLLNSAVWDADLVRDDLRAYILEHLGDPHAVMVIDEASFRKRGKSRQRWRSSIAARRTSLRIVRSASSWPISVLKAIRCSIGNCICSSVESLFSNIKCSDRYSLEEVTGCLLLLYVGGSIGSFIHCYKSILHPYPYPWAYNRHVSPVY